MIAVLTGAGISADSGIATFRDSNGLWANHRVEDICTPEALIRNRQQVIEFYNTRRRELLDAKPNEAHLALAKLEKATDVEIITQNIDDLHERAGSTHITHLHGELRKLRSSRNENGIVDFSGWQQPIDARHSDGSLLRPHVVFFGEAVPMIENAVEIVQRADVLLVIGTSLNVYPAAGLVGYTSPDTHIYIVDPAANERDFRMPYIPNPTTVIPERAAIGVPHLVDKLIAELQNR